MIDPDGAESPDETVDAPASRLWPRIAAAYAGAIAAAIGVGLLLANSSDVEYQQNAIYMPLGCGVIAVAVAASAVGLAKQRRWGRIAFLVSVPWASLALGSAFASLLWKTDSPFTSALAFVFAPFVFALTRRRAAQSLGIRRSGWMSREGPLLLAFLVLLMNALLLVVLLKPPVASTFDSFEAFNSYNASVNDHVRRLIVVQVLLWHYGLAFLLALIPSGSTKPKPADVDKR